MPGDGRSVSWVASAEDLCSTSMTDSAFADILQRFHYTYIYLTKTEVQHVSNVPPDAVCLRHSTLLS